MDIPFLAQGKTVIFTGATSAPTPVQCVADSQSNSEQFLLTNEGTVTVFVGYGPTSVSATDNAVIPTATARRVYPLLGGTQVVISGPRDGYFTGITASGTAAVYVTPGIGQ